MTERRGTKALELWCRRITDGYPGVNVQNMTTSWRDGLAFCAMIHHFRPDLIDFDSLNKDDVYSNNELAFRTAAEHLGIPALLDAEDMASCSVPDRLSILTYLSQFYQSFGGSSPSRLALSRTKESPNEGITPVAESTTPKMGPRMGMRRREHCAGCGMPVFLAEKLVISRKAYHRTCFRCARCANQLTPGNYYETEDGEYCCETCPDEEDSTTVSSAYHESRPLSDEEKSERRVQEISITSLARKSDEDRSEREKELDEISNGNLIRKSDEEKSELKINLEKISAPRSDDSLLLEYKNSFSEYKSPLTEYKHSQLAQTRLNYMTSHLLAEDRKENSGSTCNEEENSPLNVNDVNDSPSYPEEIRKNRRESEGSLIDKISEKYVDDETMPCGLEIDHSSSKHDDNIEIRDVRDSNAVRLASERIDYLDDRLLADSLDDELTRRECFDTANKTAIASDDRHPHLDSKEISIEQNTKDKIGLDIASRLETSDESLSLVQRRLKMFDSPKIQTPKNENLVSSTTESLEKLHIEDSRKVSKIEEKAREETRTPEVSSTTNEQEQIIQENVTSEEKSSPPPVPKRLNVKSRREEKFDTKKSEVTVLNASGVDLSDHEDYPKELNPFGSDDEDEETREIHESPKKSENVRVSTNPFGSSEDEEENEEIVIPPRPAARNISKPVEENPVENEETSSDAAPTKRRLKAPQINLNPFWSDDEEESEEEQTSNFTATTPVPKPRNLKPSLEPSPWKNNLNRSEMYASSSSLASAGSTSTPGGTYRKKKPAPPPPVKEILTSGAESFTGSNNSVRSTPKARKAKPAPPPPMTSSATSSLTPSLSASESAITESDRVSESRDYEAWKEPKNGKDEANRNKQSMTALSCEESSPYDIYTDKSVQGKWKRKKGPAPARPIPHRRKIKVMSLKDVKLELDEIEMKQQGLEKQGVRLEQLIRDKAESGNTAEDACLGMDVEELVLELFALVNEKNELFRRQAELMLLKRQQRLEEEHADIEYQIRCLLCQPEATKTDFDKQREETLIQRLVEIVERRNEIVECLEMDRRREVEEDRSINTRMEIFVYAARNREDTTKEVEEEASNRSKKSKKLKLKEKAKEKILRKVQKKDADKDIDETEVKTKRQNKKKWF